MKGTKVLGLIYASAYDQAMPEFTAHRTMGSVPFGARYRLIDFALSNMVNSGVTKVGVITKNNYRSLMDHIGSGKPWDLSRKREGLFILPPYNSVINAGGSFKNRIDSLIGCRTFLKHSSKEYVLVSDCNTIYNVDLCDFFEAHEKSGADITIAYTHGKTPNLAGTMIFSFDKDSRVNNVKISSEGGAIEDYSLNIFIIKKALLERLIDEAASMHYKDFEADIIQRGVEKLKIYGYDANNFARTVDSIESYYKVSMELLDAENRKKLFCRERPIYTKVRDEVPAIYGLSANVKNSLIADGCTIEGTVENSIIFRGVTIGKDAVVKNSIVMQGSYIGDKAQITSVIMDKDAVIKPGQMLFGTETFPIYVGKGIVV